MSFYERFSELCRLRKVSPSKAAQECGINRSNVTSWKNNGYAPRGNALKRIAEYFDVSTDYLLGQEEEKPQVNGDQELEELLEELKNRPECRMLFQLAKDATADEVRQAVKVIEALRR